MKLEEIYRSRIDDDRYNTSYPLCPEDWAQYQVSSELSFKGVYELCFYLHIPFCQHLCRFCEYTRMRCPNKAVQLNYIRAVRNDVEQFVAAYPKIKLYGFDIGGGTPTALCDEAFAELLDLYAMVVDRIPVSIDYEPSIEATFATITNTKTTLIAQRGIKRISLGVQSSSNTVLSENRREPATWSKMKDSLDMLHEYGINKVNLDFMYGLQGQTLESLQTDILLIKNLQPEQVTLYELRTNMIELTSHTSATDRYKMYVLLYDALISLGYHASFGQNTFSRDVSDMGVSSYLRHRIRDCMPYKGFGMSAQSMTHQGVSYNIGKNNRALSSIVRSNSFTSQQTYHLPPRDIAAKYVAISAYSGAFSWSNFQKLLGNDKTPWYEDALRYAINNELLSKECDLIRITKTGFKHYGAVFSLFYPSHNNI